MDCKQRDEIGDTGISGRGKGECYCRKGETQQQYSPTESSSGSTMLSSSVLFVDFFVFVFQLVIFLYCFSYFHTAVTSKMCFGMSKLLMKMAKMCCQHDGNIFLGENVVCLS